MPSLIPLARVSFQFLFSYKIITLQMSFYYLTFPNFYNFLLFFLIFYSIY